MKTAAESQILKLSAESPNVKVGLLSFNSSVFVYGDGSTPCQTVDGGATKEMLLQRGHEQTVLKPLSESRHDVLRALSR